MIPPVFHDDTTLVLRRTFHAERARVFRAWITPKALESWLRPRGMSMKVRSLDAQVGGSFCFDLEDGSSLMGTYLLIIYPEKLVYTWSGGAAQDWKTVVTLDFIDRGAITDVVLMHEGLHTPEQRTRVTSGWPSMFDTLDIILASSYLDF